jgi:hypothetical protein
VAIIPPWYWKSSSESAMSYSRVSVLWAATAIRRYARSMSLSGIGSSPVSRREASSQTGRAPSRASTSVTSSPEVRMLAVPQTDRPTESG